MNVSQMQVSLKQKDHPINNLFRITDPSQLLEQINIQAQRLIDYVTHEIRSIALRAKDDLLVRFREVQRTVEAYHAVADNLLEKLGDFESTVLYNLCNRDNVQHLNDKYQELVESVFHQLQERSKEIFRIFNGTHVKIPGVEVLAPNFLNSNEIGIDLDFYINQSMEIKTINIELNTFTYLDMIEIDLGGFQERRQLKLINELFKSLEGFYGLESLKLCFQNTNISELSGLAIVLSKMPKLRLLELDFSKTNITDLILFGLALGQLEQLERLWMNFQETPIQSVSELYNPLTKMKYLEEFSINLRDTKLPGQLNNFFGSGFNFMNTLKKFYDL